MNSDASPGAPDSTGFRLAQLLKLAGAVEVAVGLLHFAMPTFYRRSLALKELPAKDGDFLVLMTFAVGILLIAFGAMTLVFARLPLDRLELLVPYLIIKSVLWAARLLLEILYPVQLDMFGIEPFTAIVTPGLAIELGLFATAAFLARRHRNALELGR